MTIIQRAAYRLMNDGWAKGSLEEFQGPRKCMLGALAAEAGLPVTAGIYGLLSEALPLEMQTLRDVILEEVYGQDNLDHASAAAIIVYFNDDDLTTFEDVVAIMEEAEIRMGNIGEPVKTVEFEPMPETAPMVEPAAPAVAPAEEPVPV